MAKTPADIDSIKWRSIVAFAVRNLEPPKLNNRALNEVSQYYFASALQSLALDRLSEIRNLIVHKSGKIDQRFLQKADHLGLPKGAIGEQVRVDGNNLPSILGQVAVASTNLIKAVDSWIATN